MFDILKILHIRHLSLNQLKDDTESPPSATPINPKPKNHHILLPLRLLLGQRRPQLGRHHIMPLPLRRRALAHCRLERPQLRDRLQVPNRSNRLLQEIRVAIPWSRLVQNSLEEPRVLLQVL